MPIGWLMSDKQHSLYWKLWTKACEAQGWTKKKGWNYEQVEARRREVMQATFGRAISAKEVDSRRMFDSIKARFEALANKVAGALEMDHPEIGESRRSHFGLREIEKCLAHYGVDAAAYLQQIINDKFNHGRGGEMTRRTVDELSDLPRTRLDSRGELIELPSELQQLRMTAWARLQDYRNAAGESLHEMKTGAGVPCDCAACTRARSALIETGKRRTGEPTIAPTSPTVSPVPQSAICNPYSEDPF